MIAKGEGKLHQRALPHAFASLDEVDLGYYEEQQMLPPP